MQPVPIACALIGVGLLMWWVDSMAAEGGTMHFERELGLSDGSLLVGLGTSAGTFSRRFAFRNHHHCRTFSAHDSRNCRAVLIPAFDAADCRRSRQRTPQTFARAQSRNDGHFPFHDIHSHRRFRHRRLPRYRISSALPANTHAESFCCLPRRPRYTYPVTRFIPSGPHAIAPARPRRESNHRYPPT